MKTMKTLVTLVTLMALMVVITASGVWAYSFDFVGAYEVHDTDHDGFTENFSLNFGFGGKAPIILAHPGFDSVLDVGSYVVFAPLLLDPINFVSGASYGFTNNPYIQGLKVYDAANTVLMTADFTLDALIVDVATGRINADLALNLSNAIQWVSGSPILDAFAPNGALNITLNFSRAISDILEHGNSETGSFSGSAIAPVPEPTTLLLVGVGLIGLIGVGRKMKP